MATKFDPDKYKKIFEDRHGPGSYESGMSKARAAGKAKADSEFAKESYKQRLEEAEKAQKEAEKAAKARAKEEAKKAKEALEKDEAQRKARGAELNKKMKKGKLTVEDMENTPKDRWTAIPSSTKGAHDGKKLTSSNALRQPNAIEKYFKNETKKAIAKNPKPKAKKKNSNVLDDLFEVAKDAFQVNVLKQDPKKVTANTVKKYKKENKEISKSTKELSRGIVRATDSATLGAVKELSKKTKNAKTADDLFFNDREIGKGGVTDMVTSGLGYLAPGAGAYKALNATKAGKALTKAGSKSTAKRLGTEAVKGATIGGAMSGAEVGIREPLNPDDYSASDNLKHIGLGIGTGAVADPLMYGLGKGIQKGIQSEPIQRVLRNWKRGDKVQTPNGEGEVVGTSIPRIGDKTPVVRVQTAEGRIEEFKPEMLALPAPKTRGPLEQFTQPRGLDNPIPSFSPTVRNRMTASAVRNDDFVGFGQRSRPSQARPAPMAQSNQPNYDEIYEGFVRFVNEKGYTPNDLNKEALDELFTQYAPYEMTVSLDDVVENVYKNNPGFNRTGQQYEQPISPAEPALDDLLRRDPRINQALESLVQTAETPPVQAPTQPSLDDLMKQLEGSVQDAYASGSIDANPTRPQVNKAEEKLYKTANDLMQQGKDEEALKIFESIAKGEEPKGLQGGLRLDGQFFNPDAQIQKSPTPINLSDPKESVSAINQQTNPVKRTFDKFYEGAINFRHSLHVGDVMRTQSALNKAIAAGDDKAIESLTNRLTSAKKNGSQIEKAATNEEAAVNTTKSILDRHMNGLTKVLKGTDLSVTDALHYQIAKNVRYIWDNVDPDYKLAKDWDKERINRIINDGDLGKNKEVFKQSAQTFKGMMDEVRQIMLDYDLKPQEEIDLLSKNEFYIPMFRDRGWQKDNVSSGQKFNRRDTINAELDLYNLEGGDLDNYLKNPLESLAELTHDVVRKGLQNDTALELKKLADIETDFPDNDQVLVRYAKDDETPDIVGTQGGKEFKLVVQEDMKEILDSGADPKIPSNLLAKLTRTYAGLKTRSLAHQIVAVPRDLVQGYWNSQINDPLRYLAEMAHAIKSSNVDAKKVGGLFEAGYNDHTGGVKSHNKLIEDFKNQYSDKKFDIMDMKGNVGKLTNILDKTVFAPAKYLGQQSDSIMRNIEVKEVERQYTSRIKQLEEEIASAKQGGDFSDVTQGLDVKVQELNDLKKEMRREQTYQARDMMNYQRTGRAGFVKNIVKPYAIFANTTTQSKDKFFRSFKKNPLGMTAKVGVPVAGMYMAQQSAYENASPEDKEMLDLAPDYVKNYYYMFPNGEGQWTLVPKPHEAIPIISAIEAGAEKYLGNREITVGDPMNEVFRMIAKEYVPFQLGHVAQAAVPDRYGDLGGATVPGSLPTLATNVLANKKLDFNGKPISYDNPYPVKGTGGKFNPDEGQMLLGNGLTQELASAPWTPEYAKNLGGEAVNADYIDYVIQNLLGDVGKVGSSTVERELKGEDQLEALLRDLTYRKVYRDRYTDSKKQKTAFPEED